MEIEGIDNYEIWYNFTYCQYLNNNKNNIKYHNVIYTKENRFKYGDEIPKEVTILGEKCFGAINKYINGASNIKDIIIPFSIHSLNYKCFYYCTSLTSINLPSSLTSLNDKCFYRCESLKTIIIPSLIQSLGNNCFGRCSSLKSINLPPTITSLSNKCFYRCESLKFINSPSSIKFLGDYCFNHCNSLQSINLPSILTSLNTGCFRNCSSLQSINLPSSITDFGNECFEGCTQLQGRINVPDKFFYECEPESLPLFDVDSDFGSGSVFKFRKNPYHTSNDSDSECILFEDDYYDDISFDGYLEEDL